MALNGLGLSYRLLAEDDPDPKSPLHKSAEALRLAASLWKQLEQQDHYAGALNNLGITYQAMAQRGLDPVQHLHQSIDVIQEAVQLRKAQQAWLSYGRAQTNLGAAYLLLADLDSPRAEHLDLARVALEEALRVFAQLDRRAYVQGVRTELRKVLQGLIEAGANADRHRARLKELAGG